jgi:predicted membrane protein
VQPVAVLALHCRCCSHLLILNWYFTVLYSQVNSFFWFGQPGLIISLLQLLQFLLAVSVAMLVEFGAKLKTDTELGVSIVMVGAALVVYTVTLPRVIPAYTMVSHSVYSSYAQLLLCSTRSVYAHAV